MAAVFALGLLAIGIELGAMILYRSGAMTMGIPPLTLDRHISYTDPWVLDINEHFGVWHPPGAKSTHTSGCFKVQMEANSYGARDIERPLKSGSQTRRVVLGDSFVEGYGVDVDKRFTNLVEAATDKPQLNFGTSGYFSVLQSVLLYEHLASKFEHDEVLLSILPANDFWDEDVDYCKEWHSDRYRPYLVGEYPNYEVKYLWKPLEESRFSKKNFEAYVADFEEDARQARRDPKHWMRSYSHAYAAISFFLQVSKSNETATTFQGIPHDYSGYLSVTDTQWDRMRFSLERLLKLKGDRPLTIMVIPSENDLIQHARSENGKLPFSEKIGTFVAAHPDSNIQLLDLMDRFSKEPDAAKDCFLFCDPHWNNKGSQIAADELIRLEK